jgi:photosystem II stability/assembly factor-like uncharacterized protein
MGGGGGAGGSGGGFPQTVGKCDGLKASGQWEYIWQSIAPPRTGSQAGDSVGLVVDPFDGGTVWVGAFQKGLFKSTDCGGSWSHVNTGRNGSRIDEGSLVSLAVDPVEKGVIYATPIYGAGGIWKTTNGGVDWDNLVPSTNPVSKVMFDCVSMDPTDHRHLVIGTHDNCPAPYAPTCELETTDGGANWNVVLTPFLKGWEEQAGPWVIDTMSWLYGGGSGLWLTTDRGKNWKNVTPSGTNYFDGGEVENHSLPRGADGTYYLTSLEGIVKSSDAHTWSIIPNSGGRTVGFAMGGGSLFSSDQWSNTYHVSSEAQPTTWKTITPPAALPASQGAPYLSYDSAHHVLYSSNFAGGLWRVVLP